MMSMLCEGLSQRRYANPTLRLDWVVRLHSHQCDLCSSGTPFGASWQSHTFLSRFRSANSLGKPFWRAQMSVRLHCVVLFFPNVRPASALVYSLRHTRMLGV